ncbi:two-component system sensor histidine kinase KdpD [Deinobacterium chartae]|uniref:Two-component system sensor histidine kinase KdpD n=1 Tax=Deinobacterium chartae TaxID=521158 RepID=A0A841I5W8_9DEIO|nr:universal stress protein [Deinobacterium chartae]MBB6099265.1 two-component system sensor histidine kinase KdpD [Deinobacterium chartae]
MPETPESRFPDSEDVSPPPDPTVRGRHKIYVGAAAGVGKTFRALQEIRELQAEGRDAVIGVLETHGRQDTERAAEGLRVFPRRITEFKGAQLSEMDLEGLLAARPEVVLVDELAHGNAPGSRNPKRYQDVQGLLSAGIHVISTVNIQHIESLNDLVARLTGVRVRERVPDAVISEADEVILVDVTPQVLQERLRAGKIYAPDKVEQALKNFFTEENLAALRELALRQVAEAVEVEPQDKLSIKDRILVAVTTSPSSGRLIRRGGRIAKRLGGDLQVVYVETHRPSREEARVLEGFRAITEALGGEFRLLKNAGGVGRTLVNYSREYGPTQLILGESRRSRWQELLRGSIIHQVLRGTRNVDVYIIAEEQD